MELKDLEKALEQVKKSKELTLKCQNNRKQARASRLIGIILLKLENYDSSIQHFNDSIELLEIEEASYELAKSLYFRAINYNRLNKPEDANRDLKAASLSIRKIDKCKWTKIIEHGIN